MTVIWNTILQRINATSKSLQSVECELFKGSILLKSLENFINNFREEYEKVEKEATDLSGLSFSVEDEQTRRRRKRNVFFDENKEVGHEFTITIREDFKVNSFYVICDNTKAQLSQRAQKYEVVLEPFRIFFDWKLSTEERKKALKKLKDMYKNDIDVCTLEDELDHFLIFLKENEDTIKTTPDNPDILGFSCDSGVECVDRYHIYRAAKEMSCTFPNIEILLKIFLTIPLSNASGERSFSVLKRVKNYLRNTMGEERLNNLAILYIEQEILNRIDTDKIIDDFARNKARRKFII